MGAYTGLIPSVSGFLTNSYLIPKLGPRGFTNFALVTGALTWIVLGAWKTGVGFYTGYTLTIFGLYTAASHVKSVAAKHAVASGLGVGEYNGQFANLRSLVYVIAPFINSSLFDFSLSRKLHPAFSFSSIVGLGFLVPL